MLIRKIQPIQFGHFISETIDELAKSQCQKSGAGLAESARLRENDHENPDWRIREIHTLPPNALKLQIPSGGQHVRRSKSIKTQMSELLERGPNTPRAILRDHESDSTVQK